MRRILNQAANAAVKYKGSIFAILYTAAMCYAWGTIKHDRVIAHRLCRLIWKICTKECATRNGPGV